MYFANDECNYNHPNGGTANWANDWLVANPTHELTEISALCSSCAHSVSLNCLKKGVASWFLWAIIAGWEPQSSGINHNIKNEIEVYPNPFNVNITIDLDIALFDPTVELIDLQGRVLFKKKFKGTMKSIHLTQINLETGIYILKVRDRDKEYNKKIMHSIIN